ncbi:MAG: penicillin acylase family protein [Myxococcales bacterium]|nr:penicillin acylase family protein [Myxococcales bacterium]
MRRQRIVLEARHRTRAELRSNSLCAKSGRRSVYFDAEGVLHAECSTDADCYAAQGYFHTTHRFFQMDLRRRLARGRLAELAGPILLDTDERSRTVLATKTGGRIEQSLWDNAPPKT